MTHSHDTIEHGEGGAFRVGDGAWDEVAPEVHAAAPAPVVRPPSPTHAHARPVVRLPSLPEHVRTMPTRTHASTPFGHYAD